MVSLYLQVLATLLAVGTHVVTVASQDTNLTANRTSATLPFWQNYTYCEGRTVERSTWKPLQNASMVKLQVMHRHGARSPAAGPVPGDKTQWYQCGDPDQFVFMNQGDVVASGRSPFLKEMTTIDGSFAYYLWQGNCDLGQLTSLGSRRMQEVGAALRQIYVDQLAFLPSQMDSSFNVSHTYIWRTRESVENLMNGMYPLSYRQANQTLTMHVKPSVIETMLAQTTACARLASLQAAYSRSSSYAASLAPYASLQNRIVAAYGTANLSSWNTTQTLYDTASAAYCHGLGLKGNLTATDIQLATIPGTALYHELFRSNPNATEVKRLAMSGWLTQIVASFSDRSSKLQVYSAHDASLDMFLAVVANPDLPWPAFSSTVEIELWNHQQMGMVVRMYYEGMLVPAHPDLKCDFSACPFDVLKAYMETYIVSDLQTACNV